MPDSANGVSTTRSAPTPFAARPGPGRTPQAPPEPGNERARTRQTGGPPPVRRRLLLQPVRDAEDAAERADVLTHQQHRRVGPQRRTQPEVDRLGPVSYTHLTLP